MEIILAIVFSVALLSVLVVRVGRRSLGDGGRDRGRRAHGDGDSTVDVSPHLMMMGIDGSVKHSDVVRADAGGGRDAGSSEVSEGSSHCGSSDGGGWGGSDGGGCGDGGGGDGGGGGGGD